MKKPELKKIRADIVLLAALLLVGLVLLAGILLTRKEGAVVEISVGGEVIETLPLNKDTTYTIEGKGGGKNYLTIQDGEAWLTDATCPDQLCVYMGKVSQNGQSIICLPNEVVVWVIDKDATNGTSDVDVMSGGNQ